jgi:hypothetical protein
MIDWPNIRPLIQEQITSFAEVVLPQNVRWVDVPSGPLQGAQPVIWLRVSSISDVGIDEQLYEDTPHGNDLTSLIGGQRTFVLSIRCEAQNADLTDPSHPANIVQRIKTRFSRQSGLDERADIFGVYDWSKAQWFDYLADNRPVAVYVLDLMCCTVDNDDDLTEDAGAWIGATTGDGIIKETDGSTVATVPLDVDAR